MNIRKLTMLLAVIMFAMLTTSTVLAQCAKIKDGTITDANAQPITLGFDKYGYNYQAHMFNGLYANYTRPPVPVQTGDINLIMKWSDDWLSNQDCFGNDGKLDRGGAANVSKGWLTNHQEGDYELNGVTCHFTYFVKIVYDAGAACVAREPSCIWGAYTVIEEVNNDECGTHGIDRTKLINPAGLGFYTN